MTSNTAAGSKRKRDDDDEPVAKITSNFEEMITLKASPSGKKLFCYKDIFDARRIKTSYVAKEDSGFDRMIVVDDSSIKLYLEYIHHAEAINIVATAKALHDGVTGKAKIINVLANAYSLGSQLGDHVFQDSVMDCLLSQQPSTGEIDVKAAKALFVQPGSDDSTRLRTWLIETLVHCLSLRNVRQINDGVLTGGKSGEEWRRLNRQLLYQYAKNAMSVAPTKMPSYKDREEYLYNI